MLKNITRNFSLSSFKPSLLPKSVRIVEVGLRDGLQNEKTNGENKPIDVNIKTELLHLLSKTGLKNIEAGSFVSPKAVPQMANSNEVFEYINKNFNKQTSPIVFSALTPNIKGLEQAMQLGVEEVAIFGAASEGFSQKNINCSISESLKRFEAIFQFMNDNNYHPKVRGYVSCVLGCPYEGKTITPEKVYEVSKALLDMGCYEISLGDTIGIGDAGSTHRLLSYIVPKIGEEKLAVHFHNTYGQALSNILVSLQHNISVIDSSVSGLGGCPYAKGASGNVATEDVVYMLHGLGIETGIDMDKLLVASNYIDQKLNRASESKVAFALRKK